MDEITVALMQSGRTASVASILVEVAERGCLVVSTVRQGMEVVVAAAVRQG